MSDPVSSPSPTLAEYFAGDDWYKFTEELDADRVADILSTEHPPSNSSHETSTATLDVACAEFMAENGEALFSALDRLKANWE